MFRSLIRFLAEKLNAFKLAYLHVMRADFFGVQKGDVMAVAREKYKGILVGNMGYSADEAEAAGDEDLHFRFPCFFGKYSFTKYSQVSRSPSSKPTTGLPFSSAAERGSATVS